MSNNGISCLMKNGRNLTDNDRTLLLRLAVEVYLSSSDVRTFRTDHSEGCVSTKRVWVSMGSIFGMKFFAEVSTPAGDLKIEYIVRPFDLKRLGSGIWTDTPSSDLERLTQPVDTSLN